MSGRVIPLSQGKFAVVDRADYPALAAHKWSTLRIRKAGTERFYAVRYEKRHETTGKPKMLLMHRVITAAPRGKVVDHRDNNGLHNRRHNMRVCTQAENSLNHRGHADRKSRYKGVSWHKQNKKWVADFRGRYIGSFLTEEQAAASYDSAAQAHSSSFALLNCDMRG